LLLGGGTSGYDTGLAPVLDARFSILRGGANKNLPGGAQEKVNSKVCPASMRWEIDREARREPKENIELAVKAVLRPTNLEALKEPWP